MKSPEEYKDGLTGTNEKYDQKQTNWGSYQTSPSQFPNPEGMVKFMGFGMDEKDYDRGFCKPYIHNDPEYDMANYKERWTEYRVEDEDSDGGLTAFERDRQFRDKDRKTKGLFVRPHIPTER